MSPLIIADKYIEHVCQALDIPYTKTRRLIIDAQVGYPVHVYAEMFGDDELLKFSPVKVTEAEIKETA